jgi:hypothetical protein
MNHIIKDNDPNTDSEAIEIKRLDDLLPYVDKVTLIKIDVEDFETEVLQGAKGILNNQNLKAIIIELKGSGWKYGFDENNIHKELLSFGFTPHQYEPFTRKLTEVDKPGSENTIYVRDRIFVQKRIQKSKKINVLGNSF